MSLVIPDTWRIPKAYRQAKKEVITPSYWRALYATHLLARSRGPQFRRFRATFLVAALDVLELQGDSIDVDLDWLPGSDARAYLSHHYGLTFDDRGNQLTPTREQIQESINEARTMFGRAPYLDFVAAHVARQTEAASA